MGEKIVFEQSLFDILFTIRLKLDFYQSWLVLDEDLQQSIGEAMFGFQFYVTRSDKDGICDQPVNKVLRVGFYQPFHNIVPRLCHTERTPPKPNILLTS